MQLRIISGLILAASAVHGFAAVSFTQINPTLSALRNPTNFLTGSNYNCIFTKDATDPDVFVNGISLTVGPGWDANLDVLASSSFGDFAFGTPISGSQNRYVYLAGRNGSVDSSVPLGQYQFNTKVLGGDDANAQNILADFDWVIDVKNSFNLSLSAVVSLAFVNPGQTTDVTATVTNNESEAILLNSWYIKSGANSAYPTVPWGFHFNPGWGITMNPGVTETRLHHYFTPDAATPMQTYNVYGGVIGGYYEGDAHWQGWTQPPQFTVVPEPVTLVALGIGILALGRRRLNR